MIFPLELDLLVLKSLRKNPLQRQQNMTELYEDLHHVQQELSRVPELTLPGQAGKRSGVAAAILEDLSDLFGIDNSLKIKLAVPIILGLVVIFGSILIGSILPQNIRAADPATLAERDAEKEWQQLDMQAQRDFEHHNLLSAEEHYERALQIAEKFKDDRRRLYGTLQKLQNIYMAEKRYDKSDEIEAHLKAFMEEDAK